MTQDEQIARLLGQIRHVQQETSRTVTQLTVLHQQLAHLAQALGHSNLGTFYPVQDKE